MNNRIREVRRTLGLSQTEFGRRIGMGKSGVCRIENGSITPTAQTVKSICREFSVDHLWLTTGEGEPFRDDHATLCELVDVMMGEATAAEREAFKGIIELDRRYWVAIHNFLKEIKG